MTGWGASVDRVAGWRWRAGGLEMIVAELELACCWGDGLQLVGWSWCNWGWQAGGDGLQCVGLWTAAGRLKQGDRRLKLVSWWEGTYSHKPKPRMH